MASKSSLGIIVEAGAVVLIAIATQIRDGKTGEPDDSQLLAAKLLYNHAYKGLVG